MWGGIYEVNQKQHISILNTESAELQRQMNANFKKFNRKNALVYTIVTFPALYLYFTMIVLFVQIYLFPEFRDLSAVHVTYCYTHKHR